MGNDDGVVMEMKRRNLVSIVFPIPHSRIPNLFTTLRSYFIAHRSSFCLSPLTSVQNQSAYGL